MLSGDNAIFFCSRLPDGDAAAAAAAERHLSRRHTDCAAEPCPCGQAGIRLQTKGKNARLFTICLHFSLHLSSLLRTDSAPVFCYNYIT